MATAAERKREQRRREKLDNSPTADNIKRQLFNTILSAAKVACDMSQEGRKEQPTVEMIINSVAQQYPECDRSRVKEYLGWRDTSQDDRSGAKV